MKTRKLAEVGMALIAVYYMGASMLPVASTIALSVSRLSNLRESPATTVVVVVGSLLTAAIPLVFAGLLIGHRRRIALLIVPEDESNDREATEKSPGWETAAYRLVFVGIGVLFLGWAVTKASILPYYLFWYPLTEEMGTGVSLPNVIWREAGVKQIINIASQLLLGLFLVLRAPRLAVWCAARANKAGAAQSS